ncbi:hypothetical protein SUDANB95_01882 [Actinosynnema sp. ALI-1.44]
MLTGTRPWKRLAAFAATRNHATLADTAAALGIHHKTLYRYIRRLENELGQQLLRRNGAGCHTETMPTAYGRALALTIATQLDRQPELASAAGGAGPGSDPE